MNSLRIGIDARLKGLQHAGIGRYIEELVRHVLEQDTPHEWVIFVSHADERVITRNTRVKTVVVPVKHYTLAEQLLMPAVFLKEKLDLLHVPHFNVPIAYPKKFVVTIHDLLWHERRDPKATTLSPLMYRLKHRGYLCVAQTAIKRAAAVMVPSLHVKQVVELYRASGVYVTPEGIADAFTHVRARNTRRLFGFPYLLYVGSLYPHKNVPIVLEALRDFPHLHLVVASARTVFTDAFLESVREYGLESRVHMQGFVPDEQLAAYTAQAVALVSPSLSEGFGLPGVQAMAVGTPVIASDIPVFREVYADAALYFSPSNGRALVSAIRNVQKPSVRAALIRAGKVCATQYSWERMADQTLQIYENV